MFSLFVFIFFSIFFVFVFYFLNILFSFKEVSMQKNTSFESGFLSLGKIQNSFSIHFFVIMIIFVIFDLEIVMFLGILISDSNSFFVLLMLFVFVFIGFYMEWWYGKLLWIS